MPKHDAVHPKLTENDIEGQLQLGKKINQAGEGGPPTTACGPHGDRAKSGESPTAAAVRAQPGSPQTQRGGRGGSAQKPRPRGGRGGGVWRQLRAHSPAPPPAASGPERKTEPLPAQGHLRAAGRGCCGHPGRGRPEDTQAGGSPRTARTKGCEAFRKAAGTRGSPVPGSERMRAWTAARPGSPPPCAAPSLPASLLAPPPSFSTGLLFSPIALAGFSSSSYFPP